MQDDCENPTISLGERTAYLPARDTLKTRWHSAFVSMGGTPMELHSLSPPELHSAVTPGPEIPQVPVALYVLGPLT